MSLSNVTRRNALVMGVANKRSIAFGCVQSLLRHNYNVIFTYAEERFETMANNICSETPNTQCLKCNVESNDVATFFEHDLPNMLQQHNNNNDQHSLDTIVHSIAYAPATAMKESCLLDTTRQDFTQAMETSAYSLIKVARHSQQLLHKESGSITALSYLGAQRAVPNYNIMGPAKAALESIVRGLALELQPSQRINAVSAGPIRTMASRGISNFDSILTDVEQRAPIGRNVTVQEVADTVAFLSSDDASGITGQTIFVDGGYSIVAGPPLK